jgi:hypothetical protein
MIPQKFYRELGFGREADCIMGEGMLILRPITPISDSEFAVQILTELIGEGYSGQELIEEFKRRQRKVHPAVEALLAEARAVVQGVGEYSTIDEIIGTEG